MTKKSLNLILARLAAIEEELAALRGAALAAAAPRKRPARKAAKKKAPAKRKHPLGVIPRPKKQRANGSAHPA